MRTMAHTVAITTSAAQTMRAAVAFAKNTMCRRGSSAKVVRTSRDCQSAATMKIARIGTNMLTADPIPRSAPAMLTEDESSSRAIAATPAPTITQSRTVRPSAHRVPRVARTLRSSACRLRANRSAVVGSLSTRVKDVTFHSVLSTGQTPVQGADGLPILRELVDRDPVGDEEQAQRAGVGVHREPGTVGAAVKGMPRSASARRRRSGSAGTTSRGSRRSDRPPLRSGGCRLRSEPRCGRRRSAALRADAWTPARIPRCVRVMDQSGPQPIRRLDVETVHRLVQDQVPGRPTSATASATLCFMPSESAPKRRRAAGRARGHR